MLAGPQVPSDRLQVLDGMRGMAAMAVVVYHYLARWAPPAHPQMLYPHGNHRDLLPGLGDYGLFGVFLFFMISGFVIMMTLERSTGLADFVLRRLLRLWPAMIVCAALSSLVVNRSGLAAFYGMPHWQVEFPEFVSSVLFLPPELTYRFFDVPHEGHWVEGVYWTLWAEVRFYAVAALVYFLAPRKAFLWFWLAVQTVAAVVAALPVLRPDLAGNFFYPNLLLQPQTLPWFTLGICGYRYWKGDTPLPVWLMLVPAFAVLWLLADDWQKIALYCAVWGVFALFLGRSPLLAPLRWRPVLLVGLASYPLYLFHEMPGMAAFMLASTLGLDAHFAVVLTVAAVVLVALAVHYLIEEPVKRRLSAPLKRAARWTERRIPLLRFRNSTLVSNSDINHRLNINS